MVFLTAISSPSPKSEKTFLSGDCQLYFSTGSLVPCQPSFDGKHVVAPLAGARLAHQKCSTPTRP